MKRVCLPEIAVCFAVVDTLDVVPVAVVEIQVQMVSLDPIHLREQLVDAMYFC